MLSGEPGIGKTRLALELIDRAHKDGAAILRGGCYEYEATTPYLPFVEAVRDWVNKQTVEALRAQLGDTATELAKLAPELESKLGSLKPNPPLAPNEERLRLFDSMARFLQTLAANRGLLLFIDDLHWTDRGTLSLLHYMLRHLRNDRVMVLSAYRDVELDRSHPLAGILVDWNREHLITRLTLGRFSREDTTSMLTTLFGDDTISAEFADLVFRETEGNPFFVEEVVKALIEQGGIYRSGDRWGRRDIYELSIPQSVKEAVGRRLSRLSAACAEVLTMAAGLGKQFLFSELIAANTTDEDAILDALDEAAAAQLIFSTGEESFSFTHDKIREVLIEELNPIRRRRLHHRIGERLERLYASNPDPRAGDLAYHYTLSGDLQKSLAHSLRAAKNAENMFGHDEALTYYEQARKAAEELGHLDQVVSIDESMGEVYNQRGELASAVDAFKRGLAGTTQSAWQASIKARIGCVYGIVGDPRGLPYLHEAVKELDVQSQTNDLANATAALGRYHHYHAQHMKAIEYLEQARSLAEPIGNPLTLQTIYSHLAGANGHLATLNKSDECKSDEWARATITLGERKNHLHAQALGHEFLAENAICRGHWDESLRQTARNRELADKMGALNRRAWSEYPRTLALWGKGRLAEAYQVGQAALELCERIGETRLATWIEPSLAIIATDLGEDEVAERYARGGLQRGESLGQVALHSYSLHAMGYWHMRRLNWEEAVRCYQQMLALLRPTENRIISLYSHAYVAEAFLGSGLVAESMDLIDEAIDLAEFAQAAHLRALSKRVQAQGFVKLGRLEEAVAAFGEAIAELDRLGSRLELGRALYHRAKLWLERGEIEPADADASRAKSILADCGAKRDTKRAETLLAMR
jgi:tetratricopeptide (TPR) repeat protein